MSRRKLQCTGEIVANGMFPNHLKLGRAALSLKIYLKETPVTSPETS